MDWFVAKNEKQLGLCLRMLYDEGVEARVTVCENDKRRIEYHIIPDVDKALFGRFRERYRILIS